MGNKRVFKKQAGVIPCLFFSIWKIGLGKKVGVLFWNEKCVIDHIHRRNIRTFHHCDTIEITSLPKCFHHYIEH